MANYTCLKGELGLPWLIPLKTVGLTQNKDIIDHIYENIDSGIYIPNCLSDCH